MRIMTFLMVSAAVVMGVMGPASASPGSGSGTIEYRATATFSDGSSADRLYAVRLDADSDGDGIGDEGWLRVRCADGAVAAAFEYDVKSPRDTATGQASGRRMHKPFTITKVVDSSSPLFGKTGGGKAVRGKVSWDLVQGKGSRVDHSRASDASAGKGADRKTMAHDSWATAAIREGSPNLCD